MTAALAKIYYEKALESADNDEQRSYATLMLHYMHKLNYTFRSVPDNKAKAVYYAGKFMKYEETKTYEMCERKCPGIFFYATHMKSK